MYNHKEVQAPLDKNKILELYNGGMRQKEIVDLFKCTKSTISMIIKKYNKIH
jgi:DNA invertase Pin-like site-specific DNA recombinase